MKRESGNVRKIGEMVDGEGGIGVRTIAAGMTLVLILAASLFAVSTPRASAAVVDSHILRFEALPPYINLKMRTSIEVEIQSLYVSEPSDYKVTVVRPDMTMSTAWYNFTSLGAIVIEYGNSSNEYGSTVDQVGVYDLMLEHFNGTGFEPAGYAQFTATDELFVVVEAATASNEYTDVHNCPIAQEFQRGGEVIARAYVTYASTGEFVNGTTNPTAKGKITGTIWGQTKTLAWHNTYHFWRAAWFPSWDTPSGIFIFNVTASDGLGNHGVGISPSQGLTAWKIIPAIIKVVPSIRNATSAESTLFMPGDTLTIDARVTYEGHKAHNKDFPGPLSTDRGGQVSGVLGYGPFNISSGQFETTLATITLSPDPVTKNWVGNYTIKNNDPIRSDLQVVVQAIDGTSPPNSGSAFSTQFSFVEKPSSEPPPVIQQTTTGLDNMLAIILTVVALIAGIGVGAVVGMRGRSKTPPIEGAEDEEVKP